MSYRTFKRLLGETSLERKCRFLFGGGLMLLIAGSFYAYGKLTQDLVYKQNLNAGRLLIYPITLEKHWKWDSQKPNPDAEEGVPRFAGENFQPVIEQMSIDLKPPDLISSELISPHSEDPTKRPSDQEGFSALHAIELKLQQGAQDVDIFKVLTKEGEYHYYGAVLAKHSCTQCHEHEKAKEGDLLGMVKVVFALAPTERALALNNAILISTAIGTAFLAMMASWAIVRYVIVKPVLHLKEVSDSISRGNLDRRADIRTGDEFEELSQAFNRMLRHLVTVQEELKQVNVTLDSKVDELAQANMRLFELNNLKNDFLATMTHELRTPLNSILGFSDVLAGAENMNDKQQRYLKNIQTSGKDLLLLVNDILDLAKIESGKMDLHIVEFSLADLIERLVGMMRPMADKRNIDLSGSVEEGLPLLTQDAGKIQQIMYNLLSNAIKFTPEGGRVQTTARLVSDGTFELAVEDTGVGIALEDQATIFEKFRQGNTTPGREGSSLTREYAGTGLGLSIVKELCKLLGGEVSLQSELGKGSTFTVRLPVQLKEQPKLLQDALSRAILDLEHYKKLSDPAVK